jgi:hypothetical protein
LTAHETTLAYLGWRGRWVLALVWLAGVPLFEWLYIRKFPSLSPSMGIRSIPVVEAGARLLFGLATTKELAEAVAEAQRVGV